MRVRGLRGRANEIRRPLLSRRDTLHLFDLEIAFSLPWAVVLPGYRVRGLVAMMIFLLILIVVSCTNGRKGALEWE
jgi:hypothetical protein